MDICSDSHDEIVYDESRCPLCAALAELKDKEKQLDEAKDEVEEVTKRLQAIEETIQDWLKSVGEVREKLELVDLETI